MKKQIPWKFLPLVLLLIALPAIPGMLMRQNTREQAQAAVQTTRVNETELRQLIVDNMVEAGFTRADGECTATILFRNHTPSKLAELLRAGNWNGLYTPPVEVELMQECGIKVTH